MIQSFNGKLLNIIYDQVYTNNMQEIKSNIGFGVERKGKTIAFQVSSGNREEKLQEIYWLNEYSGSDRKFPDWI